jgi:preprotein translocase subunit SecA
MLSTALFDRLLARPRRSTSPSSQAVELVLAVRRQVAALRGSNDCELQRRFADLRAAAHWDPGASREQKLTTLLALVSESLRRVLGIELYDVQLMAGAALCRGCIAEMQTGEGKTFTIALPASWFALGGEGVHVVTANAYLAQRDLELLRPVYELLGLTVALLPERAANEAKRRAYQCDITYGTGYEFGFDYLRDQLESGSRQLEPLGTNYLRRLREGIDTGATLQRGLVHAIVDEVDNVLLDDASSPLVIAGATSDTAPDVEAHRQAGQIVAQLRTNVDYRLLHDGTAAQLTAEGLDRVHAADVAIPLTVLERPWAEYVRQALQARQVLRRDVHYVVQGDEIQIVDATTGRIFADRTWQDGLHQAIEAKENLPIRGERRPLAGITRQRLFRLYRQLCGLTGTARGSEAEFRSVYRLPVEVIPPHRPSQLLVHAPRYFASHAAVFRAATARASELAARGRAVLVGTSSIYHSEALSQHLTAQGVGHQVLNGRQDAEEAAVIAQAGQSGQVTVATNLAGRGTDIKLAPETAAAGGLHVIACGRNRSRRIDRQLSGRAARQGAPGSVEFLVACEDALIADAAPWMVSRFQQQARVDGLVEEDWTATLDRLQRRAERTDTTSRRRLLEVDTFRESVFSSLPDLHS